MANTDTVLLEGDLKNLERIASALIYHAGHQRIWLFDGEIGVGKTTLIKFLCKKLGVKEVVTSPTFALVNEYLCIKNEKIYHFDCYRLNNKQDILRIDFELYFETGSYCFIEWPSKITKIIPSDYFYIKIEKNKYNNSRKIYGKTR